MVTSSRLWRWGAPLAVAAAIWLMPHAGFSPQQWGLLCLYASTVCGLITRPIPPGAMILIAATSGTLLKLFSVQDALSGYGNVTVWLIVAAFLFSAAFVKTRLGERIAYTIVRHLGRSPLRLGYSIVLADLVMAPMTPSNTARAGGILFPITLNVARAFGSEPGPTAVAHRRVPDEDALSGRPRRLGHVPDGDRAEPARRRVRASAGRHRASRG